MIIDDSWISNDRFSLMYFQKDSRDVYEGVNVSTQWPDSPYSSDTKPFSEKNR